MTSLFESLRCMQTIIDEALVEFTEVRTADSSIVQDPVFEMWTRRVS